MVSLWRPFARLAASTRRPFAVAIRCLKPCLFLLLRTDGWNVLFMNASSLSLNYLTLKTCPETDPSYRREGTNNF